MVGLTRFLFLIDAELSDGSVEWIKQNSEDFLRGFPLQNGKGYLLAKNQILFFDKSPTEVGVPLLVQSITQSPENIRYLHEQLIKNSEPKNSTPYSVTEPTWFAKKVGALGSYKTHDDSEIRYDLLSSPAEKVNFSQRQLNVEDSKVLVSILDITPLNLNEVDVSVRGFQADVEKTDKSVLIDITAYTNLLDKINQSISAPEAFNSEGLEALENNKIKLEESIEKAHQHNRLAALISIDLEPFRNAVRFLQLQMQTINHQVEQALEKKERVEMPAELNQLGYSHSVLSKYIEPLRLQSRIDQLKPHLELLSTFDQLIREKSNLRSRIQQHNRLVEIYENILIKMNGWKENPLDDDLEEYCAELRKIKEKVETLPEYIDSGVNGSIVDEIKLLASEAEVKLNNIALLENIRDFKGSISRLLQEYGNISTLSLEEVNEKILETDGIIIDLKEIQKSDAKTLTAYRELQNQIDRVERVSGELKVIKELREKEEIFKNLSSNLPYSTVYDINVFLEKIDNFQKSLSEFEESFLSSNIERLKETLKNTLAEIKVNQEEIKPIKELSEDEVQTENKGSIEDNISNDIITFISKIEEVKKDFDNIKGLSPIEFKKGKSGEIFDLIKRDLNQLKAELYVMKSNHQSLEINEERLKDKLNKYIEKTEENIEKLKGHNKIKKDNPLIEALNNFIYKIKVNINKQYKNSVSFFKADSKAETQVGKTTYVPKRQQRLEVGNQVIQKLSIFRQEQRQKDEVPSPKTGTAAPAA